MLASLLAAPAITLMNRPAQRCFGRQASEARLRRPASAPPKAGPSCEVLPDHQTKAAGARSELSRELRRSMLRLDDRTTN